MHILTLCTLLTVLPFLQSELVQVIQLARHGARTPNFNEFLPNQYDEKERELTVLGVAQHYFLGQEMRKRYVENTRFLQDTFNSSEVLIRSSWKNRTVRSAFAFANGLYPQETGVWLDNRYAEGFPPDEIIPLKKKQNSLTKEDIKRIKIDEDWAKEVVNIIPLEGDLHFHAAKDGNCPIAEKVAKKIKKSREITEMENFLSLALYPTLAARINSYLGSELLKPEVLNMKKAKSVLDHYGSNLFHGQDKPFIDEITLKLLKKMKYFNEYKVTLIDEMVRTISASKLLEEFARFMKAARDGVEGIPKFVFYSAHDNTLKMLFSIFLLESQIATEEQYNMVPFASVLGFELHREYKTGEDMNGIETKEEYYVKMLYNDEPQFIKWCMGYECTLNQFTKILESYIVPNLEEICGVGKLREVYQADEPICVITSDDKIECNAKVNK